MNNTIHPTAIVSPQAHLGDDISIGPYSVIGPYVSLGDHVHIDSHVVIKGQTTIGRNTTVYPFACLGDVPQIRDYQSDDSRLIIGEHNYIGHYVTMNGGSSKGDGLTRVGDHCMFMASCHVAHDCQIGNYVTLANAVLMAGHVCVDDYVTFGGAGAISQHLHIGKAAMVSGFSGVVHDIIPYGCAKGPRASLDSINIIGMKRLGMDKREIHAMLYFFKTVLFKNDNLPFQERLAQYKAENIEQYPSITEVIQFIENRSNQSICLPDSAAH